jgi:thiol-disulfide isomerase/thioredoxin
MKRTISILLILFAVAVTSFAAKSSYKITFIAENSKDSVLYMGFYLAQYKYICDTAFNNGKGKFVFEGDEELDPGLYYITNNKDRFAEFIVYNEKQRFTISTDNDNWKLGMTAKGSRENEIFFNFNRANEVFYQEFDIAKKTMDSVEFNTVFLPSQRLRLDSIRLSFIAQYPDCMLSRMMLSTKDVDVPKLHADGTKMTDRERFEWLQIHFFDNMPLDDNFILRTPKTVFYDRVMEYLDRLLNRMPPEVICPLLDSLIDRAEPAPRVYRWLILNLTQHYLQSHVMVYDEVYVHLVQRYFSTGKVQGLEPSTIDEQIERANKWERLLVGRVSPELILFDTVHRAYSLHHMPGRYTLLLFWSPTCGHCRDVIPAVYKVYEKYADSLDVSAFAILTEPDDQTIEKWKKFLSDHQMTDPRWVHLNGSEANVDWREVYDVTTTPQIYLIDNSDHKFVAKKLSADILETIFQALMK